MLILYIKTDNKHLHKKVKSINLMYKNRICVHIQYPSSIFIHKTVKR